MNSCDRFCVQFALCLMVVGMFCVAFAGPIPRTEREGMEIGKLSPNSSLKQPNPSSNQGCWHVPPQGGENYFTGVGQTETDCLSPFGGEAAWIYAPGCAKLEAFNHKIQSGHCSADDQLVSNLGNLVVHSSDRVLGRVDISDSVRESEKPPAHMIPRPQEDANSWNYISPTVQMNRALMATAFRFDRLGHELFDDRTDERAKLIPEYDHRLVMSGRLAHLVPKSGQPSRSLEFGDLIFLLLFAIFPEKKRIRRLFRYAWQLRMMKFNSYTYH